MTYVVTYLEYDLGDYSLILDFQTRTPRVAIKLSKYRPGTKFSGQLAYLVRYWRRAQMQTHLEGRLLRAHLTGERWCDQTRIINGRVRYSTRFLARVIKFSPLMLGFQPLAVEQYCWFAPRWSTLAVRQWLKTV